MSQECPLRHGLGLRGSKCGEDGGNKDNDVDDGDNEMMTLEDFLAKDNVVDYADHDHNHDPDYDNILS